MITPDIRIVRAIHRPELTSAGDAALEFFRRLVPNWLLERIGATADEEGAGDAESDREGLQARTILKKVTSDK